MIFAAGYVEAPGPLVLLDQARSNGVAGLIDIPGVPAIQLVLGLFSYKPSKEVVDEATRRRPRRSRRRAPTGAGC